jgi:hypothetical protein
MFGRFQRTRLVLPAVLLAAMLAGCGEKEVIIVNYPVFYNESLKTVAVAPFRNASGVAGAGDVVSDSLASMLVANGTYRVYNRNDLHILQSEQELQIQAGLDNAKIAAKFRKVAEVQAILVGTINTYAATKRDEPRFEQTPIYQYNAYTKQMYISGYNTRQYTLTRNEANVGVSAALIRVSDGTTIYATPAPIHGNFWAQGSPPQYDAFACLNLATTGAVNQLVTTFAVTRQMIKVKESEDFRTAKDLYDNKWEWQDGFKASVDQAYLVVRLPKVCDRNRFRLVVIRKNQRQEFFAQDIAWKSLGDGFSIIGFTFSPKALTEKAGGPGEFEAKFYSGPEPIMRHTFRVDS